MKKILILFCLIALSCSKNEKLKTQSNNSYKITANIENMRDSLTVVLTKMDRKNFYAQDIDSTFSSNGLFKFQGNTSFPEEFILSIRDYQNNEFKRLFLWLENKDISIIGNYDEFENSDIEGSQLTKIFKNYEDISNSLSEQMRNGEIDFAMYKKELKDKSMAFLYNNPNNTVALSIMTNLMNNVSRDSLNLFYSKLDSIQKNSSNGISLKNYLTNMPVKVGAQMVDFMAKDLNGNEVRLSDYKGKVILLDFWAYWCHYCHEQNQHEFPYLLEKYKNRDFIIISYSVDLDKKLWEQSSKNDNISWVNLSNLRGVDDLVAFQYGVKAYPTSFLIDPNGVVKKEFMGFERGVIEKEIDKLLN